MADEPLLFDVAPREPLAEGPGPLVPAWMGRGGTPTQRLRACRGFHPTGRKIGPEGTRCGDCKHFTSHTRSMKYLKCLLDRQQWTAGPGSDLRAKWRGCERFEVAT